jgi:hypothetical protein
VDVVLHGQRNVVPIEGREGVVVEIGEHLLVRGRGSVVLALTCLVALLGLAVAAGARDVRRIARLPETPEVGDGRQIAAELGGSIRSRGCARLAVATKALAEGRGS